MANPITNLGAKLISSNLGEIQRVNHFELQFTFAQDSPIFAELNRTLGDKSFSWFVKNVDLPKEKSEVIEYAHGNSIVKYAGRTTYEDTSITVLDSCSVDIEKYITEWRRVIYNANKDLIGKAVDYKATLTIYQYSPDGAIRRKWVLKGAWPSSVEFGSLDATGTEFKEASVTITYDYSYRD